ncbi:MAG: hypothetical protein E7279_06500 [Lachnospiraceae bacterium]|nr:hypothetical protein [Lachnospiraceae bacterium]
MASPTRVSGMVSGMDTESVVKAYVQNYVDKKNKIKQSQTKLTYKQDAWKALNTKVYSLYSKVGNLRFSNSYNLKKTTVSDATKASVSASSGAVIGTQTLKIKQLAKAGYLTGAQLGKKTTEDSTMSSLGYTGGDTSISVRVGSGEEKTIEITADSKISDVITKLKDAGVNASFDANNKRIFVSAKNSGKDNDFALTASTAQGQAALTSLGLLTTAAADMKGYANNAAYAMATDGGSYYELDEDGHIKYDNEGNAIVREGAEYSEAKTKENITNILTNLANAYEENPQLAAEKTLLNSKIEYTNSKNKVDEVRALSAEDVTGQELIDLVNAGKDGAVYVDEDGNTYKNVKVNEDGSRTYYNESEDEVGTKTVAEGEELSKIEDRVKDIAKKLGLITTTTDESGVETEDDSKYMEFVTANTVYNKYVNDDTIDEAEYYLDEAALTAANERINEIDSTIASNKAYISENSYWDKKDYSDYYSEVDGSLDMSKIEELADSILNKITYGKDVIDSVVELDANAGATRVSAQDAVIELNEAEYTSSSSNFSINGLNINALAETGDTAVTINTTQDNQGIYDKVKDFLSTYNEIINEMQSLYNADSAKGYNPLTDDQKEEMSEKEIEKWEDKIKSAILRRDSSLGNLITKMTQAMSRPIQINGRGYALSDFGIQTLGFLNAPKNEQYAYHIYGDEDDSATSSKEDKLMAMINSDPDTVIEYMQSLAANLYDAVGSEMKSTNLRSAYTVYNDKEMANDQKSYEKTIKQWEQKIADMEDRYYKKFSKMESTLAKLQSSTNALSGLMTK